MSEASAYPPDVAAILAGVDARKAAAAKVRQELSGRRDWKIPQAPHRAMAHMTPEPVAKPVYVPVWKRALRLLVERGATTTADASAILGLGSVEASNALCQARNELRKHNIAFIDTRGRGKSRKGGYVQVLDTTAARGLLA